MAKRIQAKERTLLLNSDVITQFPHVMKLLEENKDITDEFIGTLPKEQSNFFINVLPRVLKQAINEWKGDPKQLEDMGPNASGWMRCSLDNQPNRYIFYIKNTLNGTSLNVGSDCITHFWGSWSSNYEGKNMAQLKRDAGRLRLFSVLNDKMPGVGRIIESWNLLVSDCEIILPRSLEKPYLDLGRRASTIYENYLCEKECGDYEEQLKTILENRKTLISEIEEYILLKYPEKYVPKKEVRLWLKNNRLPKVVDMLIDDGEITWKTAHRIEEPAFMRSIIGELDYGMKDIDLHVVSAEVALGGYVIETISKDKVQLFSKHRDLILYCGWLLFNEKPIEDEFSLESILQLCRLNGEADMDAVLRTLMDIVSKSGIEFEDTDYENGIVTIHHKEDNEYILADIGKLTETFKGLVIGAKDKTAADLISYIKNIPGKRYTKAELKDLSIMRGEHNIRKY